MQRQLQEAFFAALIGLILSFSAFPVPARASEEALRELQAVRLLEASLRARDVSKENRKKVDGLYSALEAKFPSDVSVKNAYAAFLWECGEQDRAEKLWKAAEKIAPENSATQHGLGTVALASGDPRTAAAHMVKACAGQPGDAVYHFELANVLFLFRHELLDSEYTSAESVITRALKHYAEACRLAPMNIDFARGYAETFYSLPKPDWPAALKAWEHVHKISPQKDFALANLATIHLKLGKREDARILAERIQSPEFASRKARLLDRIQKE